MQDEARREASRNKPFFSPITWEQVMCTWEQADVTLAMVTSQVSIDSISS